VNCVTAKDRPGSSTVPIRLYSPVATRDDQAVLLIPRDARYARAQVVDARGNVLALTNPLWLRD